MFTLLKVRNIIISIFIFYQIISISSLSRWKIQGDLQLAGRQENQNSEGNQHRVYSARVPGLLAGQQGQLPAVLQPPEGLREECWHGENGRADCYSLFDPGGISLHQIPSVRIKSINYLASQLTFSSQRLREELGAGPVSSAETGRLQGFIFEIKFRNIS